MSISLLHAPSGPVTIFSAAQALGKDGKNNALVDLVGNDLRVGTASTGRSGKASPVALKLRLSELVANQLASHPEWKKLPRSVVEKLAMNAVVHVCRHTDITIDQLARLNEVTNRIVDDNQLLDAAGKDSKAATDQMSVKLGQATYLRPRPVAGMDSARGAGCCNRLTSPLYSVGGGVQHVAGRALGWLIPANVKSCHQFQSSLSLQMDLVSYVPHRVKPEFVQEKLKSMLTGEGTALEPKVLANIRHSVNTDLRCAGVVADLAQWAMDNLKEDVGNRKWAIIAQLIVDLPPGVSKHLYYEPTEIERMRDAGNSFLKLNEVGVFDAMSGIEKYARRGPRKGESVLAHVEGFRDLASAPVKSATPTHVKASQHLKEKFEALYVTLQSNAQRYEQFKSSSLYHAADGVHLDEAMEVYDEWLAAAEADEPDELAQEEGPDIGGEPESEELGGSSDDEMGLRDRKSLPSFADGPFASNLGGAGGAGLLPQLNDDKGSDTTPPSVRPAEPEKSSSGKSTARQRKDQQEQREIRKRAAEARQAKSDGRIIPRHRVFGSLPAHNTRSTITGRIKSDGKHHNPIKNKSLTPELRQLWGRPSKVVNSQV